MKHLKQIFTILLAAAVLSAVIPFTAGAASNGVQKKLDELRAVYYTGTYFTVSGEACYSSKCPDCQLSGIPSRGGLPSGADVCGGVDDNESWSCRAFANYVFYYVFGERYWNLKSTDAPVLGDFIKFNGGAHSAIYLWEDANNYYVYDSNGDSMNGVCYNRSFSKSHFVISGVYHAASYDSVMKGGSALVYRAVDEGVYFVRNAFSGLYLGGKASGGALFSLTDVHSEIIPAEARKTGTGIVVKIGTETNNWLFENAAGGYVIHSAADSSKVLTADRDNNVVLAEYTGAAGQFWRIDTSLHSFTEKMQKLSTCSEHGEKLVTCTDCGFSYIEYQTLEPHIYTVKTVEPGETSYGFTKYTCVHCGSVIRTDVKEMTGEDGLVLTDSVKQTEDGYVFINAGVTDDELLDTFPGYEASSIPATLSGIRLTPLGEEEGTVLTVIIPGDVNSDGSIDAIDARSVMRTSVGREEFTREWEKIAADIDFDGEISSADARWILRAAVGYASAATLVGAE